MSVPLLYYYQSIDLTAGLFFDYQWKRPYLTVRVYDINTRCLKKQILQPNDFATLPLMLPQGKNCDELLSWIVGQGWIPSLSAPGGFVSPTHHELPPTLTIPEPTDLCFWKDQEANFLCVKNLNQHQATLSALCETSEFLVSGDDKGMVMVSDSHDDFRCVKFFEAHREKVFAICQVREGVFATASMKEICIWEINGDEVNMLRGIAAHEGFVSSLLMLECGLLLSASADRSIKVWNPNTNFSHFKELHGHTEGVELLYEHSSGLILSTSLDGTVKVWDRRQDFNCVKTISGHEESVLALGEREDGALIGSLADGRKMIWDLKSGKCIEEKKGFKPYHLPVRALSCGLVAIGDRHLIGLWHSRPSKKSVGDDTAAGEKTLALALIDQHPGYEVLADFAATLHPGRQHKLYLYLKVAQHFMKIDDLKAAEECFKKAFKEFPDAPFNFYKSYLLLHHNKKEVLYQLCCEMITSYERANMTKDLIKACRTLLSVKKETCSFDRLYACYRQALKPQKAFEVGMAKIAFLLEENNLAEAEQMCLEMLETSPEEATLMEVHAKIAERTELLSRLTSFSLSYEEEGADSETFPSEQVVAPTGESADRTLQTMQTALVFQQYNTFPEHLTAVVKSRMIEKLPRDKQLSLLALFQIDELWKELQRTNDELEAIQSTPDQTKTEIGCIATLTDAKTTIHSICEFAPHFFAAAGEDGQMTIWTNNEDYQFRGKIPAHAKPIFALCSPRQDFIISASADQLIKLWDMKPETACVKELPGHEGAVYDLLVLDDAYFASASADKTIRIWNTQKSQCTQVLKGHEAPVHCLQRLPTGLVVSGSADKTVRFWDPTNNYNCCHIYHAPAKVHSLAVTGEQLAIGYLNGDIEIIETKTFTRISTLQGHADTVFSLLSPTSGFLFSGSADHTLRVWDLLLEEPLIQTLGDHKKGVRFLYRMQNGHLISCSNDQTMKVWSDNSQ